MALGVDMVCTHLFRLLRPYVYRRQADCVFPTRTARFGVALSFNGPVNLRKLAQYLKKLDLFFSGLSRHAVEFIPIDETCPCPTCSDGTSRALLHHMLTHETAAAHGIY